MKLLSISTDDDLDRILGDDGPIILFKHSTSCPISAAALEELEAFLESEADARAHIILVVEARAVSLALAERVGVRHESPQAILLVRGKPEWHASHGDITRESLTSAWAAARRGR